MDSEVRARVEAEIYRFMVDRGVPGLAVSVVSGAGGGDGERWILGRADASSGRPLDAGTRFRLGSISKTLTAIGLAQQVARGTLDWDDAVRSLVPDTRIVGDPAWKEMLLGHLLTHTSGIGEVSSLATLRHPLWTLGMLRPGMRIPSLDDLCGIGFRCDAPPEAKWAYSNPGFTLLGLVLQRTAGEEFEALVSRDVAEPAGMGDHAWFLQDVPPDMRAAGHSVHAGRARALPPYEFVATPAGGLLGSLGDLENLTRLVLGGGEAGGRRLVDGDVWADMVRPQFQVHPEMAAVGLGFWLDTVAGNTVVGHGGTMLGHSTQFAAIPDVGTGVCVLANRTFLPSSAFGAGHLAGRIVRILLGAGQLETRLGDPASVDGDVATEVSGTYRTEPGFLTSARAWQYFGGRVCIEHHGDALVAKAPLGPFRRGLPLHPLSADGVGTSGDRRAFAATYSGYVIPFHFARSAGGVSRPDVLYTGFAPPFRLHRAGDTCRMGVPIARGRRRGGG